MANNKRRRYDGGYVEAEEEDDGRGPGRELDPAVLEQLYVEWISTCGGAFERVEKTNLERKSYLSKTILLITNKPCLVLLDI